MLPVTFKLGQTKCQSCSRSRPSSMTYAFVAVLLGKLAGGAELFYNLVLEQNKKALEYSHSPMSICLRSRKSLLHQPRAAPPLAGDADDRRSPPACRAGSPGSPGGLAASCPLDSAFFGAGYWCHGTDRHFGRLCCIRSIYWRVARFKAVDTSEVAQAAL
jgi:hypothetical protein